MGDELRAVSRAWEQWALGRAPCECVGTVAVDEAVEAKDEDCTKPLSTEPTTALRRPQNATGTPTAGTRGGNI